MSPALSSAGASSSIAVVAVPVCDAYAQQAFTVNSIIVQGNQRVETETTFDHRISDRVRAADLTRFRR